MELLHVNKFYAPQVGGIEQVVRTVAEGMQRRGHANRVLVSVARGRGRTDAVSGIPVTRTSSLGVARSVPLAPTFPLRLRRASRGVDVVHHHLPNPLSVVSALATSPTDAAVVATYHSDIVRQQTALRFYRPLLERFLSRLDRIFVTSPRLLDRSDVLDGHRDRATVVPLSIDLDEYGPSGDVPEASATDAPPADASAADVPAADFDSPGDPDRPVVLFVGRLNYYKGVEYLLDAMASVDATLLVVGDGPRRADLEARVDRLGLDDRASFLGRVPDETLHACYAAADVFALPSVEPSEAFGIVQLEAMAYGTPVVNTDLPTGVPWVSVDGETGLTVPPRDADALADALATLLADPDRRRAYGRQARARVEARFGRERMLKTMEAEYRALVAGGDETRRSTPVDGT